jgi:hypothetical protein
MVEIMLLNKKCKTLPSFAFSSSYFPFLRYQTDSYSFLFYQPISSPTTPDSYSGGHGFKSQPGDRLYWMTVSVVLSVLPGECRDSTLKLTPKLFHPNYFQFITHHLFIRRYIIWVTGETSLNKFHIKWIVFIFNVFVTLHLNYKS